MTKLWKRAGAMTLAVAMSLSLILGNVPALAADPASTTYIRPELVMDFLGDNKDLVSGVYQSGTPGDGTLRAPSDHNQGSADNGADGKWNKYVSGDVGTGAQTIFWIGIGIKDIDQFVLSNKGKGLYSAELGLYYNPEFVEPYIPDGGNPVEQRYLDCIAQYNLGGNAHNQWTSADYQVVQALTDQEPLNDPNDTGALGDPTTPAQGYGTEEFSAADGWKMTYVSIEQKEGAAGVRFAEATHDKDATYYIAMIPFVLKKYDPTDALCIRLARNASAFSIGSAKAAADGTGAGSMEYGNWDKYTYHDPDHDLKLMFDYTGDLNIFTGERERIDYEKAQLNIVNNSGSIQNYAQMIINSEPYTPPSQIAVANYDGTPAAANRRIVKLSGGEELRVSAHKGTGVLVSISVIRVDDNSQIVPVQITQDATTGDWTDEWTFIMPTGVEAGGNPYEVLVTVTFSGDPKEDREYTATLEVDDGSISEPANTAQLSKPGGQATAILQNGTDTLKATMNTKMTVSVKRNSDYDVTVTLKESNSGTSTTLNPSVSSSNALTYTFDMPADDVLVKVEFRLADTYKATLRLEQAGGEPLNKAQLSFIDGKNTLQTSGMVSGDNANNGPHPTETGLTNNQIRTRDDRVVTVSTWCDPRYQVKRVRVYRNGVESQTVTVNHTNNSNLYTFTMPKFDVEVVVEYELIKTYKVRLVLVDYRNGEGATLNGVDDRVTAATPHTVTLNSTMDASTAPTTAPWEAWQPEAPTTVANSIEVFANAKMSVGINGLAAGRTASVNVYYPEYPPNHQDIINTTGSAASGFAFNMVALDDANNDVVYVVVTFKDTESEALTARIREIKEAGVPSTTGAEWSGLNHNLDITAYAGDQLSVNIHVDPGYYISSIQVFDDNGTYVTADGTATETGAPLGIPVTLSGIGYNNGNGGEETASFTMPSVNATLLIQYKKGPPEKEPSFTAAIRKDTTLPVDERGDGTISITNVTKGTTDTHATANSKWVDAGVDDRITATYTPDANSYVAGVTVTADVPGTMVNWTYTPGGGVEATMPAANVVVTVTFAKITPDMTPYDLTVEKAPTGVDGNTVSTVSAVATKQVTVTDTPQTATPFYEGEQVYLDIHVAAGYYIDSVTLDGVSIPFSGSGYNGGAGGNETAVFAMPAGNATVVVNFKDSSVDPYIPSLTLEVTEPAGAGNTATLTDTSQTASLGSPVTAVPTPAAGDTVEVKVNTQPGYSVDIPVLTTPTGVVSIHWTSTDTFTFVMPSDSLKVTVPFKKGGPTQFYANLIFRGDPTGVALAEGTFGDYDLLTSGPLVYSRAAQAGETIPYAVHIPDGYYISEVSVTPAKFGIIPTITGMIGYQVGDFLMPAGNVYLNITIAKGWPDEAQYPVTLHVTAPNDGTKYSSANLTDTVSGAATGNVPTSPSTINESKMVKALDGDKVRVVFAPDPDHTLDSVTLLNGDNEPVSYRWATGPTGELAIEFNVPGSSVDVYVVYTEKDPTDPPKQTVTLHASGMNGETVTLSNTTTTTVTPAAVTLTADGDSTPIPAYVGDKFTLDVSGSGRLITSAYAKTVSGTVIDLTPALAGTFVGDVPNGSFLMPIKESVDVYISFRDSDKPDPDKDEYMLTLQVTGPTGSGSVTVREYMPDGVTLIGGMSANAVGSNAMIATRGDTITAQIVPAAGYALYSLIAYTAAGERVVVSLKQQPNGTPAAQWDTYTFTMPADTTHIEAEFRKAEPNAYQIQVVVNNTVNGGQGANDAWLYTPPGDSNAFKFKSGVSAGDIFELGLIIASGYQVDSILAVPQSSGVAVNIPLPAVTSTGTQIKMPASDLVIYVTFKMDTTTRYNVIGQISYENGVTPPTSGQNEVKLEGGGSGQTSTAVSSSVLSNDARIQEAKDETVTATWSCAPGYVVSSYTVTTTTGLPVLSQPKYNEHGEMIGLEFSMPGAHVVVDVKFTDPNVEPPASFQATLHYLDYDAGTSGMVSCPGATSGTGTDGDKATITNSKAPAETTSIDGGSIRVDSHLYVGDQIDVVVKPGSGRYLQSLYVLQNGQMIPLQFTAPATGLNTTDPNAESAAYICMPAGNVDVYAVFSDHPKDPNEFTATVQVNGPAGPNLENNTATITGAHSGTAPDPSATAKGGKGPVAIVVDRNGTVTVTVVLTDGYEIDRVEGTPILLHLEPQMSPSDPLVYTFTMPASDASVIVTLKEKAVTKYKLNLHTSHVNAPAAPSENDNKTTLSYGSPVLGSITINGTGDDSMQVPAKETVTLTVEPQGPAPTPTTQGYYVRAAYGVYKNELIQLSPVLPDGFTPALPRTTGLEGVTDTDVQKGANTATFTMPAGTTDVYVVYEYGLLPLDPWYNVVVIATDTGGATNNTGASTVEVSSKTGVTGGTNAIDPKQDVPSNGVATNFYSVPVDEIIHLDATRAATGYQYDTMSLSSQVAGVTIPTLTNVDPTGHPLGEVQEFTMPGGNIGAHVNFKTAGTTGLKATLHVVRSGSVPGYPDNTATLSVGQGAAYRSVNNSTPEGDPARTLTDLASNDTITTLVNPKDPDTRIERVVVTSVEADGTPIGTVFALNPAPNEYTYIMGDKDVHVYVVLADKDDEDRFVAVAVPVYKNGVTANNGKNVLIPSGVTNITTTTGMNRADFFTEVKASDHVTVKYKAEAGVYVKVTAYQASDGLSSAGAVITPSGTPIGAAQFGVGNGSDGWAEVVVPDPGCDVRIEVEFSKDPPEAQELTFVSTGHEDLKDNTATLDIDRTTPKNTETLTPPNAVTAKADLTYEFKDYTPTGDDERVTPGTKLTLGATLAAGYGVQKVEIIVHTSAGDVTLTYYMKEVTENHVTKLVLVDSSKNPVNLVMPTDKTTVKVYFKLVEESLLPYDPDRTDNDDPYKDHWITSENRGDYLIVTVPMLNNKDGNNPTDVTWKPKEKEDRFKFYLQGGTSAAPTYTSLENVLIMSRPEGAATPGANDPPDYVLDNFYTDNSGTTPVAYTGAQFVLTVKTDAEIDADTAITDKTAAKALAATLREIIDNEGTATDPHKHRLYITCEETTYVNNTAEPAKESDYVDFEVPRYYSLVGELISYAPTHIATFTLDDGAATDPIVFTSTLQGQNGTEQWKQGFKMKLTSDWDKLDGTVFTLTIEKAGHITYTHAQIVLDKALKNGAGDALYDADELQFSFAETITLICGDIDGDGAAWEKDVDFLIGLMYGQYTWTEDKKDTDTGWAKSLYNPDSLAYAADLNGDYALSMRDLDILMGEHFGHSAAAYGDPVGLDGKPLVTTFDLRLPDWLKDMLVAEREIPDWVWEAMDSDVEIPDWAVEYIQNGEEIPAWALTMVQAGETVPDWAVELIRNEREIPAWALTMVQAGETVPDWTVEFIQNEREIPAWALTMVQAGEIVPEWAVEFLKAGEPLPDEIIELLNAGEPLPEEWPIIEVPVIPVEPQLPENSQPPLTDGEEVPSAEEEQPGGETSGENSGETTDVPDIEETPADPVNPEDPDEPAVEVPIGPGPEDDDDNKKAPEEISPTEPATDEEEQSEGPKEEPSVEPPIVVAPEETEEANVGGDASINEEEELAEDTEMPQNPAAVEKKDDSDGMLKVSQPKMVQREEIPQKTELNFENVPEESPNKKPEDAIMPEKGRQAQMK